MSNAVKNNIVSIFQFKNRISADQIARIRAMSRMIEDDRSDNPRPLSKEELIERFKLESYMAAKQPEKTVLKMVERKKGPVLVTMTASEAARYDSGTKAQVIQLKKKG